jgi:predicted O-methyltransferase YrrM
LGAPSGPSPPLTRVRRYALKTKIQRAKPLAAKQRDWRQEAWANGLYAEGATEPWTAQLVAEFCAAKQARVVLELGGFKGLTSMAIAERMMGYGGGQLIICELDKDRCDNIRQLFKAHPARTAGVMARLEQQDALTCIASLPLQSVEVAFVDDDHTASHVEQELKALMPKMVRGGIILLHDVCGPFGLDTLVRRYGGSIIELPKLHAAGGLGVITKESL